MRPITTFAFAADAERRTDIAERVATYLVAPAITSPQLRAEEVARVAEQVEIRRAMRENAGHISAFWQVPAAPAAPPAA